MIDSSSVYAHTKGIKTIGGNDPSLVGCTVSYGGNGNGHFFLCLMYVLSMEPGSE